MTLIVEFIDSHREPRHPANPAHPNGVDIDSTGGATPACFTRLPVVETIGTFVISCDECGQTAAVTAAGRRDDPRSFKTKCMKETEI